MKNNSGLTYTIIHPSSLNDEEGNGRLEVTNTHSSKVAVDKSISRSDVAEVVSKLLLSDGFKNKSIQITAGNTSIEDALKSIE